MAETVLPRDSSFRWNDEESNVSRKVPYFQHPKNPKTNPSPLVTVVSARLRAVR